MRIGIVAVHGVIPQIRHGFQDQVATALCDALNDQKNGKKWAMTVVLPRNGTVGANDVPTISRVHVADEPADDPTKEFFDVHEAFWSPIDKGKTTLVKVLTWLLTTVFLPFNDFARYRERPAKVFWDIAFVAVAILIGISAIVGAALLLAEALRNVMCLVGDGKPLPGTPPVRCPGFDAWHSYHHLFQPAAWGNAFDTLASTLGFVLSPITFVKTLHAWVVVGLAAGVIGAYLAWQAFRATFFIASNLVEFGKRDPAQLISRVFWTTGLCLSAALFIYVDWITQVGTRAHLGGVGLLLVVAVGLFNFGRSYLDWFVTNFFGDVQIYTTRDQNSDFFSLREAILEKVTTTILDVVAGSPTGAPYDRVYVMAHSLGSTISMDAILRLYDMQAAYSTEAPSALSPSDWGRIRGFITFGTALEKTKYFFSAWNATPSQDWEQWNAAVYGSIFTAERNALEAATGQGGVYWLNNWFFSDFVSDQICTYRSFLLPGDRVSENAKAMEDLRSKGPFIGRLLAENRERFGPFIPYVQTHTHYLESDWFWHPQSPSDIGVLDILTSRLVALAPSAPHARAVLGSAGPTTPPPPARAVPISSWSARFHKSWEVVR